MNLINWILSLFKTPDLSPVEPQEPIPAVTIPKNPAPVRVVKPDTKKEPVMSKQIVTFERFLQKHDAIISRVFIDGEFECYALEDAKRDVKIWGETCIPAGKYDVDLKDFGGFHNKHKTHKAYNGSYMGMLWLRNVKNFENVLTHRGNWRGNTHGCLLLGKSYREITRKGRKEMWLDNSSGAYYPFYDKVKFSAFNRSLVFRIAEKFGS